MLPRFTPWQGRQQGASASALFSVVPAVSTVVDAPQFFGLATGANRPGSAVSTAIVPRCAACHARVDHGYDQDTQGITDSAAICASRVLAAACCTVPRLASCRQAPALAAAWSAAPRALSCGGRGARRRLEARAVGRALAGASCARCELDCRSVGVRPGSPLRPAFMRLARFRSGARPIPTWCQIR